MDKNHWQAIDKLKWFLEMSVGNLYQFRFFKWHISIHIAKTVKGNFVKYKK